MMEHRHGRRPNPHALIDGLDGSTQAKAKLKMIVETLAGDRTIPDAGEILNLGESRFHVIRQEALQAALAAMEPKPIGRPPKLRAADSDALEKLAEQNRQLQRQLLGVGAQRDLALLDKPTQERAATQEISLIQGSPASKNS